eukprot:2811472-Amphidinium_carterae.2
MLAAHGILLLALGICAISFTSSDLTQLNCGLCAKRSSPTLSLSVVAVYLPCACRALACLPSLLACQSCGVLSYTSCCCLIRSHEIELRSNRSRPPSMTQMLGDPWSFLQTSTSAVIQATEPSAAVSQALNPSTLNEDVLEPDPPTVLPDMAELLAPILKQLDELRKAQISQTKQVIDCLGTIAGALEQITRQQTLLLARTPAASTAASAGEAVAKARPKPSARPGMSLKPRAKQGRRACRHVKHHSGSK